VVIVLAGQEEVLLLEW